MSVFPGSNATPALPAAERMRPQFGSLPATAVLTSGELAIERAIRAAPSWLGAPATRIVMNLPAPSPSRAICCASDSITSAISSVTLAISFGSGLMPEAPLASSSSVSLVEVSPSTLSLL